MMKDKTTSHRLNRSEFVKIVITFLGSIMGAVAGIPIIGCVISPAIKVQEIDDWIYMWTLLTKRQQTQPYIQREAHKTSSKYQEDVTSTSWTKAFSG